MTSRSRLALVAAAAVVLVVGFIIASGSSDNSSDTTAASTPATTPAASTPAATTTGATTTAPATTTTPSAPIGTVIVVQNGKPAGGVTDIKVKQGDEVRFTVRSDVSDEIHVHGYDFHKDVKAGGSVSFDFPAKIEGRFDIELEAVGEQIASLVVSP